MTFYEALSAMCNKAIELSKKNDGKFYQLAIIHKKDELDMLAGVHIKDDEPLEIEWNLLDIKNIPLNENGFSITTLAIPRDI